LAHGGESCADAGIRRQEEFVAVLCGPPKCVVVREFRLDLLDAEDDSLGIAGRESIPECGAKIESIVQILGLQKDVGVEQVGHQPPNARVRPSSWKVSVLEMPSMRSASRYRVRPSSVLSTSARVNLRL
jgi:hypothetical protein